MEISMRQNGPERRTAWQGRVLRWLLSAGLLLGCGGMLNTPSGGGESHFLRPCEASCAEGLDCIAGVCTRGCVVGADACDDLAASARCTDASVEPGAVAVCDVACTAGADCAAVGPDHECMNGFCRVGRHPTPGPSCRVLHRAYPSGATNVPAPQGCGLGMRKRRSDRALSGCDRERSNHRR
jgi:hypothetical protein